MKKETTHNEEQNAGDEGFPIQAIFMVGLIGLAILAIILKGAGVF